MSRLDEAFDLASKCWNKACTTEPEFVRAYLEHSEKLLTAHEEITGDMCKDYCVYSGVAKPKSLHHNSWVSGVRALWLIGWIDPIGQDIPRNRHNHMNTVTRWKSNLYKVGSGAIKYPYNLSLF